MQIESFEEHNRVLDVSIDRALLERLILEAIERHADVPLAQLREFGDLRIEPNMVGSPEYQSGYRARFKATIPLDLAARAV